MRTAELRAALGPTKKAAVARGAGKEVTAPAIETCNGSVEMHENPYSAAESCSGEELDFAASRKSLFSGSFAFSLVKSVGRFARCE